MGYKGHFLVDCLDLADVAPHVGGRMECLGLEVPTQQLGLASHHNALATLQRVTGQNLSSFTGDLTVLVESQCLNILSDLDLASLPQPHTVVHSEGT